MMFAVRAILLLLPCWIALSWTPTHSQLASSRRHVSISSSSSSLRMNIFDMLSGGNLVEQDSLPYDTPLCSSTSIAANTRILAVQERAISFTGEDFDIYDAQTNDCIVQVTGAMLHLPGKDKMRVRACGGGNVVAELDRKLVAMTPTYDIYRQGGEKLGWIEKAAISFTDSFDVFMEGNGGVGPFKPPPAYRIEGDLIDRNFVMKNTNNEVVAKVSKDGLLQFDAFNHYQVQVAPGMDSILVVACLCAIDEEFDEEHKEQRKKKEENGGWFA